MKLKQFGNIRQLPSGRFQVRYYPEQGLQVTARTLDGKALTFPSYEQARAWLVQREADFLQKRDPYAQNKSSDDYTLRQGVDQFLNPTSGARLLADPLRKSTSDGYRANADNWLFRQIGDFCLAEMKVTEITRADVRKWHSLILAQCVASETEIKTRAHPARAWAKSMGITTSSQGRITPAIKDAWVQAGAPIIKRYRKGHTGRNQLVKAYKLLHAVLNVAVEDELIISNPCRIRGAGEGNHPERDTATAEQVGQLAHAVPDRYSAMVLMGAYSSIRSSELAGLQRRHINPLHKTIQVEHQLSRSSAEPSMFVPCKTKSSKRTVWVDDDLMQVIIEHLNTFTDAHPDALVFTTKSGKPLYKGRKSWFVTAKRNLGLDHLVFHDLRGTGLSMMYERGASALDIKRRAGHSKIQSSEPYLHGSDKRDAVVAELLTPDLQESMETIRKLAQV